MLFHKMMVKFLKRAKLSLVEREKLSSWDYHHWPENAGDPESFSYVKIEDDSIVLLGYWRVSSFRYFFNKTPLSIIVPLYVKRKEVFIKADEIDRVVVKRNWLRDVYHIFQRVSDGSIEVHVFFIADDNESAYFKRHISEMVSTDRFVDTQSRLTSAPP